MDKKTIKELRKEAKMVSNNPAVDELVEMYSNSPCNDKNYKGKSVKEFFEDADKYCNDINL